MNASNIINNNNQITQEEINQIVPPERKMSKEEIIETIKEWVKIDDEVKRLKLYLKQQQARMKVLSEDLVNVMRSNDIDCFDSSKGKLVYSRKKTKTGLSKKFLLETLKNLFDNNTHKAEEVTNYIMDSRKEQIKEYIRRK